MATIRITNLKLRTIIGINDWEREKKQDVIINIAIRMDARRSAKSDDIKDTIDYKALTKRIITEVESSEYFLLEKLCQRVVDLVLKEKGVREASVRIDKPGALRYCDSVSLELTQKKK
jgi:FolB domain-containing protein